MTRPLLLGLVWSLLGCGGGTSAVSPTAIPLTPENLYPLTEGSAWSYDVETGEFPVLVVSRVISVEGNRVEVTQGSEPLQYEIRPDGIFRPGSGTYLLKSPIRVGAEWESTSGLTARVSSINARVETGEGRMDGCVEVTESGGDSGRNIVTTYCPGVGPVLIDARQQLQLAAQPARVVARLRGHQIVGRD